MDTIAIGISSVQEEDFITPILSQLGLATPSSDFMDDEEVHKGLACFCDLQNIQKLYFLVKSPSDKSSNCVTQEINEDLSKGVHSVIDRLAQEIESANCEADIWIIFAFCWKLHDEITYYSGSAEALHQYMKLNGGAYRLAYILQCDQYNIDLDTPFVWKLTRDR